MAIATLNPATGVVEKSFDPHTPEQVEQILARAQAANAAMRATTFAERSAWMHRAADLMDADLDMLAALAATEMGKTIPTAKYEVTKSANGMRHYADHAEEYLADETPVDASAVGASAARVVFQPIGTVLAVMPWNYPFWQVIRFAAPALMAGNTVVLPSADVAKSAEFGANSRTQNSGQSCICAKRFYVHEDVYDEWFAAFLAKMQSTTAGDPFADGTGFGPMATESVRAEAHELVEDAKAKGVTVHTGGELPAGPGFFYPATVLTGVTPEMRIYREECFGPVACVYKVSSLDEAVALANDSDFGLAASVWSTDADELTELQSRLEFGAVFANGNTASFFGLPFGGVKDSGYGRELGKFGIREFVNAKTLWTA